MQITPAKIFTGLNVVKQAVKQYTVELEMHYLQQVLRLKCRSKIFETKNIGKKYMQPNKNFYNTFFSILQILEIEGGVRWQSSFERVLLWKDD